MPLKNLLGSVCIVKLLIASLLVVSYLFLLPPGPLLPHSDAALYLQFAEEITGGNMAKPPHSYASQIRTPGYPFLLSLAGASPGSYEFQVPILHFYLGIFALLGTVIILRSSKEAFFAGLSSLVVLYSQRLYSHFAITEWSATVFLILFCAAIYRFYQSRGSLDFILMTLLASSLILIRPVLIVVLLPVGIALLVCKNIWLLRVSSLCVGLIPLIAWMGFNFTRIGHPTIATFGGMSLFGVATQIGAPEINEMDSSDFKEFVLHVKNEKRPAFGEEEKYLGNLAEIYQPRLYNHNLYRVALPWMEKKGLSASDANTLMSQYASSTIGSNFKRYFNYVAVGVWYGLKGSWLLLLGLALVLILRTRIKSDLFFAVLLISIFHLCHIALCASVQVLVYRYLNLTLYPALGLLVLALLSSLHRGQKVRLPA